MSNSSHIHAQDLTGELDCYRPRIERTSMVGAVDLGDLVSWYHLHGTWKFLTCIFICTCICMESSCV
jgi:hypothetical protein